ncbi:MAG: hypothetical protein RR406_00330 [Bacilli bacterium]
MATFNLNGYDSYSGCDIVVTARLNTISGGNGSGKEKVYTLGSIQTLSISTHQDKKPVRVIGSVNALDYTMGQRTIAGSLVFAVFDQHFATEMFKDLEKITGKTFFLPDELPAIDLTITFANEYGRTSRMAIYGVRIINEGQVMSINDLYTENTYQFVANSMEPLKKGTQTGSNSDKNKEIQIATNSDLGDSNPVYNGEDIFTYSFDKDESSLKRVLLNVDVEQPTYEGQDGIAKFGLSPIQKTGLVIVYNQLQDKIETEIYITNEHTNIYTVLLEQGLYSAWYEDNGQTLSNTVVFSIDKVGNYNMNYDDSPIIEDVSIDKIQILSNNPSHTAAVCINNISNKYLEMDLSSRKCTFKNLEENTTYTIYTKHENSNSKNIMCKTLTKQEEYVTGFKSYVYYNSNLLSTDIENYKEILDELNNDQEVLYTLSKNKSDKAKEIIYMATKYKNEFNRIINEDKINLIPTKNLDNIFGNTFKFNSGALKGNIFSVKNKKEYFVYSESYPIEITYNGKQNWTYSATSIANDYIKSPKYVYYNFAENDKAKISNLYGEANVLDKIDLTDYIAKNRKYSNNILQCLAVKDNKNIDLKLLKAPHVTLDEYSNMIFDVNYKDLLGTSNKNYFICISNIAESLDKTSFRKIGIKDKDENIFATKYLTAANQNDIFVVWIEDENNNIISDVAFCSMLEEVGDFNMTQIEKAIEKILAQMSSFSSKNNMYDIIYSIANENVSMKNLYYEMAKTFIDLNITNLNSSLFDLFKVKFNEYYINQDKYRKVFYNKNENKISFETLSKNAQLVNIKFKQNYNYEIEVKDELSTTLDTEYDYHLVYLIDSNPIIKSGFIFIDSGYKANAHSISIEEVECND